MGELSQSTDIYMYMYDYTVISPSAVSSEEGVREGEGEGEEDGEDEDGRKEGSPCDTLEATCGWEEAKKEIQLNSKKNMYMYIHVLICTPAQAHTQCSYQSASFRVVLVSR